MEKKLSRLWDENLVSGLVHVKIAFSPLCSLALFRFSQPLLQVWRCRRREIKFPINIGALFIGGNKSVLIMFGFGFCLTGPRLLLAFMIPFDLAAGCASSLVFIIYHHPLLVV